MDRSSIKQIIGYDIIAEQHFLWTASEEFLHKERTLEELLALNIKEWYKQQKVYGEKTLFFKDNKIEGLWYEVQELPDGKYTIKDVGFKEPEALD